MIVYVDLKKTLEKRRGTNPFLCLRIMETETGDVFFRSSHRCANDCEARSVNIEWI